MLRLCLLDEAVPLENLTLSVVSVIQLQNSRTVIQERDRFIGDLEEKVAFLEAEVWSRQYPCVH